MSSQDVAKRFIFTALFLICITSCVPLKSIFLGRPDKNDAYRFDSNVTYPQETNFQFDKLPKNHLIQVNDWTRDLPEFKPLEAVCKTHKVREMIIIKNDTIIFDYRKNHKNQLKLHSAYSISKSIVSCLIGMAIEDQFIEDENELVINYLPELIRNKHSASLTIKHLLNHTSGIKSSLTMDGQLYYGNDIRKEIKKVRFESNPGERQKYLNINTQILGLVLSKAVGKSLSEYAKERLWHPIGISNEILWSTDKRGVEKAFCCVSASTLDYAKFGRLYLNGGVWNDKRILSEYWYNQSIRRDTSDGSSFNFNYSWHIGLEQYGDFMAIGLYKQHLYIYPEKGIIIVLNNDRENKLDAERVNWWNVFRQIVDQL